MDYLTTLFFVFTYYLGTYWHILRLPIEENDRWKRSSNRRSKYWWLLTGFMRVVERHVQIQRNWKLGIILNTQIKRKFPILGIWLNSNSKIFTQKKIRTFKRNYEYHNRRYKFWENQKDITVIDGIRECRNDNSGGWWME